MEELVMPALCRSCAADLAHCHGTAIVHVTGWAECSDEPTCEAPEAAHAYRILCVEVDGACC